MKSKLKIKHLIQKKKVVSDLGKNIIIYMKWKVSFLKMQKLLSNYQLTTQ